MGFMGFFSTVGAIALGVWLGQLLTDWWRK
jgi:hypothetical protein